MKNFKKVVLTFISVALVLVPSTLFAATVEVKNEEELFKAISSDNTIILQSDVTLTKALEIKGSNVTIDLMVTHLLLKMDTLIYLKVSLSLLVKV